MKNLTFELSAKAFPDNSEETMRRVTARLRRDWARLLDEAEELSLLLWLADGSEILDYDGSPATPFEWAYWIGTANPETISPDDRRDLSRSLSHHPVTYLAEPPARTYGWIRQLIRVLRESFRRPLRIGAVFDPGPEFARSDFKINRHPECGSKLLLFNSSFIHVGARLKPDSRAYAAFPDGIPGDTPFGRFLGRQFACYRRDLGFDYLWLSNGIGFGFETWQVRGALFDGSRFHPERADENRAGLLDFWRELRAALPDVTIETRGSNLSAGIEMATDGAPTAEIYDRFRPAAPVNSPWAALNYNTGVELAGWMSHIAELPTPVMPYRFYINDPWWNNSPWPERYEREPWDIYLPLAIGRVDTGGVTRGANSLSLLSVDDSYGRLPRETADEVTPHLLAAFRTLPDRPGPLCWLYPFRGYHERVFGRDRQPHAVFAEEWFAAAAIQNGLPLNTVLGDRAFRPGLTGDAILLVPASATAGELEEKLCSFLDGGGRVILYGGGELLAPRLRERLGISLGEEISGTVTVAAPDFLDRCHSGNVSNQFTVHPHFTGGGLRELAPEEFLLASAIQGNQRRAIAVKRGNLAWVKTLITAAEPVPRGALIPPQPPSTEFPVERLPRQVLAAFGWRIGNLLRDPDRKTIRLAIHRHGNAFYFSGLNADTTTAVEIATPYGAPLLMGMENRVDGDAGRYHFARTLRKECRAFARSEAGCVVTARELPPGYPGVSRRIEFAGLKEAEVTFFPPPEAGRGETIHYAGVNGTLVIDW